MTPELIRADLRLRTPGPSGFNPPQIEVIERLQTLSEDEQSPLAALNVDVWGPSIGITQTTGREPVGMRDTLAEFIHWADANGYTLRPAFEWRSTDSETNGESQIVTPLITLALYNGERLQAVYPHVNGNEVNTIHDGIEALEVMGEPGDADRRTTSRTTKRTG